MSGHGRPGWYKQVVLPLMWEVIRNRGVKDKMIRRALINQAGPSADMKRWRAEVDFQLNLARSGYAPGPFISVDDRVTINRCIMAGNGINMEPASMCKPKDGNP